MEKKVSSKDAMVKSLLELCKNKSVNKVTVNQIVENCGYSRKSFYNCFDSKYELVMYIFEKTTYEIIDNYANNQPWGIVLGRIYRFMYDNKYLFGKDWNAEDLNLLKAEIYICVQKYYHNAYIKLNGKDSITEEFEFINRYNSHGATNMIIEWIKNDWKISPEEIGIRLDNALPLLLKELTTKYIQ